ncbi:hypothetical protein P152DRAFT_481828 [Eremomyces bilateralis CBS 781.70]|uniref:Uncharacterized protein n=1 Tax=Eremomyces bilateralis CBS 781.70 TaxID=1392243 RepID=A0A6G1G4T5_9PEZI|nr:uncharacterized protein P152DRAFT_481828 [Eremomyces bilateralis CBS 781.70]KAF1812951.1 hypothetical protein P152DRAFT_481828 [Eremomyces bilateralis CBS 781.70]
MAPDLNSVPPSPRSPTSPSAAQTPQPSTSSSRRTSQIYPMNPPPLPLATPGGGLPTNTHPFPPLSPVSSSHNHESGSGVPMRHPRPLTAAELHSELEKEQEAVVNRLTRELAALRAHSASVASTTSSTSTAPVLLDPSDPSTTTTSVSLAGPTHPTASRRHRSSSSVSRGSVTTAHIGIPLTSATASIPHHHRPSAGTVQLEQAGAPYGTSLRSNSIGLTSPRYEETAMYRHELEEAKKENEALRQKVRELEVLLRQRRSSSASSARGT